MARRPISIPIVSYSELDAFRQCPFKHQLAYKQRWQAPSVGPALARGTLWHQVMEIHYRCLMALQRADITDEQRVAILEARKDDLQSLLGLRGGAFRSDDQVLIEWMYRGYLEYYGDTEREWRWRILAVEHNSEVWLPHPEGKRSSIKLKVKIDLIVQDAMRHIWLVDHKSGKDLPKDKELDIDDQFTLYTWALRSIGKNVFGAVHNAARTYKLKTKEQPLDERFHRTRMPRTEAELQVAAIDAYKTAETAWRRYRPDEDAPRAPDADRCKWRCDFTEPCLNDRRQPGRLRQQLQAFGFVQDFTRH